MRPDSRVLLLSHSLPDPSGDGGQQRMDALVRGIETTGAHLSGAYFLWARDAESVTANLPGLAQSVLNVGVDEPDYVWWLHEYFLGLRAADNGELAQRAAKMLRGVDVLIVDHLWGWALARRAIASAAWNGRVVYHAHNAEALAREVALADEARRSPVTNSTINALRRYEADLCRAADLVIACTDGDAEELRRLGARRTAVVANGAHRHIDANRRAPKDRYLFIASAWHPNSHGFRELVLRALPLLNTRLSIDVVGGVGEAVRDDIDSSRAAWRADHDIRILGRLPKSELQSLYQSASAVLIPLLLGTGSCIKTAEALVNGLPAVTTSHGARGFEEPIRVRQHAWTVADTPTEWTDALREPQRALVDPEQSLEWQHLSAIFGALALDVT